MMSIDSTAIVSHKPVTSTTSTNDGFFPARTSKEKKTGISPQWRCDYTSSTRTPLPRDQHCHHLLSGPSGSGSSWKNTSDVPGQRLPLLPLARAFQNYPSSVERRNSWDDKKRCWSSSLCNSIRKNNINNTSNYPSSSVSRFASAGGDNKNNRAGGSFNTDYTKGSAVSIYGAFPSSSSTSQNTIVCANCGKSGHVYRSCGLPITSFGVICFRWTIDPVSGVRAPQYLMVQRKDSLCFVEFVRGRYDPANKDYVMHLLRKMTRSEREHIRTLSFPELWHGFWQTDQNKGYYKEFQQAQNKFNSLQRGITPRDGSQKTICLESLLNSTVSEHDEKEWGFPKGRRNINERDLGCALREFREETGISFQSVHVHSYAAPFEEVFTACNKVNYKHVYYLVQLRQDEDFDLYTTDSDVTLQGEKSQMREISRVRWLECQDVRQKINEDNVERMKMFDKVHETVTSSNTLQRIQHTIHPIHPITKTETSYSW